jgi:molybdopterin converting factor small subunit
MSNDTTINIRVSGSLTQHVAAETTVHNVRTVGEAVTRLNLPEVGELIMLVNGRLAHWQMEVKDGDVLQLIPAISGG